MCIYLVCVCVCTLKRNTVMAAKIIAMQYRLYCKYGTVLGKNKTTLNLTTNNVLKQALQVAFLFHVCVCGELQEAAS